MVHWNWYFLIYWPQLNSQVGPLSTMNSPMPMSYIDYWRFFLIKKLYLFFEHFVLILLRWLQFNGKTWSKLFPNFGATSNPLYHQSLCTSHCGPTHAITSLKPQNQRWNYNLSLILFYSFFGCLKVNSITFDVIVS